MIVPMIKYRNMSDRNCCVLRLCSGSNMMLYAKVEVELPNGNEEFEYCSRDHYKYFPLD